MSDGEVANTLLGAWRYVGTSINGNNWDRGANPKGMIYYGPHGEMAVQIAPDVKRTRAGAVMTPDEAFAARSKITSPISAPIRWTMRPAPSRIIGKTVCSPAIRAIWCGATN